MGEGTQSPVGERRRRREAARAAERAAEQAGQPLTRRELRRREAEEAARLEAIATGELDVGAVQRDAARSWTEPAPADVLPHRTPFLFVDEVVAVDPGRSATGRWHLTGDEAFFAGTPLRSNFLINLGHGDASALFPRSPRLAFDEAARIA